MLSSLLCFRKMNNQEERETGVSSGLNWCRQDVLRTTGLYPLSTDAKKIQKILHNIYSALCVLLSATLLFGQYMFLYFKSDILRSVLGGTSETIAFTMVLMMAVVFRWTVEKHMGVETMLGNYFKITYLRSSRRTFNIIMRETETSIARFTVASCSLMLLTHMSFVMAPVLTDCINGSEIFTEMPMKAWLPFELNTWRRRASVYATESLIVTYYCFAMLGIVNFYIYVLNLLSAQFKILKIDFKSFTNGVRGGIPRVCDMRHDVLVSFRLETNVENHQKLLG